MKKMNLKRIGKMFKRTGVLIGYQNTKKKKDYRQWKSCGVENFKVYIGIFMHMGLVRLSRMKSHWVFSEHSS